MRKWAKDILDLNDPYLKSRERDNGMVRSVNECASYKINFKIFFKVFRTRRCQL